MADVLDVEEDVVAVLERGCSNGPADSPLAESLPSAGPWLHCSAAEGDREVEWSWSMRPEDSDARILGLNRRRPPLIIDKPGTYRIALRYVDSAGVEQRQEFDVQREPIEIPAGELYIELYWDAESEADPIAHRGAFQHDRPELDISLINAELGCWGDDGAECSVGTQGQRGFGADCNVDADVMGSIGPEVLALKGVEAPTVFRVGARLYDGGDWGDVHGIALVLGGEGGVQLFDTAPLEGERRFVELLSIDATAEGFSLSAIDTPEVVHEDDRTCE